MGLARLAPWVTLRAARVASSAPGWIRSFSDHDPGDCATAEAGAPALPGPLSPASVPLHRSPRDAFDRIVSEILAALEPHFVRETDDVDIVVEEAPLLPPEWDDPVPSSVVAQHLTPARLILYRLPLSRGCTSRADLEDAVWDAVLDGLAEVWHVPPDSLDPR